TAVAPPSTPHWRTCWSRSAPASADSPPPAAASSPLCCANSPPDSTATRNDRQPRNRPTTGSMTTKEAIMTIDFSGAQPPRRDRIRGRWGDLAPLDPTVHAHSLFPAVSPPEVIEERVRYLPQTPQTARRQFDAWLAEAAVSSGPLFFTVVDRATGRAEGRQALMRIDAHNGVIEIGHILWGPALSRTRAATEALFLCADLVFSGGFRRFEWKCDDDNGPSKRAAERFGFTCE